MGGAGGRLNPTSLISGIGFPPRAPEIAGEKVEKPGKGGREGGRGKSARDGGRSGGFFRVDGQSELVKTEARNKLDRSRCLGSFRTFQKSLRNEGIYI